MKIFPAIEGMNSNADDPDADANDDADDAAAA